MSMPIKVSWTKWTIIPLFNSNGSSVGVAVCLCGNMACILHKCSFVVLESKWTLDCTKEDFHECLMQSNPIARWHIGQGSINGLAFSPDGMYLATVGRDGMFIPFLLFTQTFRIFYNYLISSSSGNLKLLTFWSLLYQETAAFDWPISDLEKQWLLSFSNTVLEDHYIYIEKLLAVEETRRLDSMIWMMRVLAILMVCMLQLTWHGS